MGNLNSSEADLTFLNGFCFYLNQSKEQRIYISLSADYLNFSTGEVINFLNFSTGEGNTAFQSIELDSNFKILSENPEKQCIVISYLSSKGKSSNILRTETVEQFQTWSSYFKSLMRPSWDSSNSQFCKVCAKEFNFFRRQHHCRKCGKVVCKKHGNKKMWLQDLGYTKKQRVCIACFNI